MADTVHGDSLHALVSHCPSCGSEKTGMKSTSLGYTAWWVECVDCGHTGPSYFDQNCARVCWNGLARRATANVGFSTGGDVSAEGRCRDGALPAHLLNRITEANRRHAALHRPSGLVGVGGVLPPMLDACCGSRMFWFDRTNPLALFMDKRDEQHVLCDGRELKISPDLVADFTDMPFPDESFWLVVFDPPHMNSLGTNSWLAKKYGRLLGDWRDDLREGFSECFRVLKTNGTLVFKWNTTDISLEEVLALAPCPPVFGHTTGRQAKTVWATFFKGGGGAEQAGDSAATQQSGAGSQNVGDQQRP